MKIKEKIRLLRYTPAGRYFHSEYWRRKEKQLSKTDDYTFIKEEYKRTTGRNLCLENPTRMTEKLQWLKLFWRDKDMPGCSDKYLVRDFIKEHGYGDMLNELICVYEDYKDIDIDALPERFVLKATHGSGWNLICKDKSKENWYWWKKTFKSWQNRNLYWYGREWNYKELKPRFIVEKYLEDDSGELRDYKIICLGGKPCFMQIDENRTTDHKRCYVKPDGTLYDMTDGAKALKNFEFNDNHRRMFEIASELCKKYSYIRVDFYLCNNKIYFGELTFFGASGFFSFDPDEFDELFGKEMILPEPNYNLDLYNKLMNK